MQLASHLQKNRFTFFCCSDIDKLISKIKSLYGESILHSQTYKEQYWNIFAFLPLSYTNSDGEILSSLRLCQGLPITTIEVHQSKL